eukprot:2056193-Rhodomonas_salina.1
MMQWFQQVHQGATDGLNQASEGVTDLVDHSVWGVKVVGGQVFDDANTLADALQQRKTEDQGLLIR